MIVAQALEPTTIQRGVLAGAARWAASWRRALGHALAFVVAIAASPAAAEDRRTAIVTAAPYSGIEVATEDPRFSMVFRGRFQVRGTFRRSSDEKTNEVELRRARLYLEGNLASKRLTYDFQLGVAPADVTDGGTDEPSPLYDASITYELSKSARLKVGQFLVPLDRARTTLYSASQFVDRAAALDEVVLGRDVGLKLFSEDLFGQSGLFAYHVGVFSGEGRHPVASSRGLLYVGRFVMRPFGAFDDEAEGDLSRSKRLRLALGVASAYNHDARRARGTRGDELDLGGFDHVHGAIDALFKLAGLSIFAEVVARQVVGSAVHERHAPGEPATEWSRAAVAYMAQAGYMLTDRLEFAVRWDKLRALGTTDPELVERTRRRGEEVGVATSWYIHGHDMKLQADYFYQLGDDLGAGRHQARAQLQVSY